MEGWRDGWMGGWMEGWDGWMEGCMPHSRPTPQPHIHTLSLSYTRPPHPPTSPPTLLYSPPQNALTEAGIPIDLSLAASPSTAASGGMGGGGGNSLEQDYAEFKQPDANGDDRISRKEVSQLVGQAVGLLVCWSGLLLDPSIHINAPNNKQTVQRLGT